VAPKSAVFAQKAAVVRNIREFTPGVEFPSAEDG
jgi:hypothetical protein